MLRYIAAAQALRFFSLNSVTRALYRRLGNVLGGRSRASKVDPIYIMRASENLKFAESVGAIRDGMRVMELGTGWVHWEALFTRLFYDLEIYLFDVWDNRQFAGFIHFARHLRANLRTEVDRPTDQINRAEALLDRVLTCANFDEVYALLGFKYILHEQGRLDALPEASLDLVISSDVLEHVDRDALPALVADLARVLKSNGHCVSQIVEEDHLRIYDRKVHSKNYMRYPDWVWQLFFENRVQYINRLQHSDFVALFAVNFDIISEKIVSSAKHIPFKIAESFNRYDETDLCAGVTRLAVRRKYRKVSLEKATSANGAFGSTTDWSCVKASCRADTSDFSASTNKPRSRGRGECIGVASDLPGHAQTRSPLRRHPQEKNHVPKKIPRPESPGFANQAV
jgi:SAM-dependent methyltransferase